MASRILVVDDNPIVRVVLKDALERHGYRVVADSENMEEALAAYDEHRPDAVTLDLSMVGENGLAVLKALRAKDAQARVLIISGTAQEKMVAELMREGASGYLAKPFTADELVAAVAKVLPA